MINIEIVRTKAGCSPFCWVSVNEDDGKIYAWHSKASEAHLLNQSPAHEIPKVDQYMDALFAWIRTQHD